MSPPIETSHLFPLLDEKLIELLQSLSPQDWSKPTLAKQWTVKDIAAHLLDGNIRTISMIGHNYFGEKSDPINSYQDLVNFLNRLNAEWVKAMRRVSPVIITDLLESTGVEYHETLATLKPFDNALFSVDWAGEKESQNWFHIAREYTEKWHHQKQIREAVRRPGIMEPEFYSPLIQTFMYALPHTYRNVDAPDGSAVHVKIGDHQWTTTREPNRWAFTQASAKSDVSIEIDPDVAWKLFTKGITKQEAATTIRFKGDEALGKPILDMIAVMA
jgi:uncharacterized protein (TIGR03083 family)